MRSACPRPYPPPAPSARPRLRRTPAPACAEQAGEQAQARHCLLRRPLSPAAGFFFRLRRAVWSATCPPSIHIHKYIFIYQEGPKRGFIYAYTRPSTRVRSTECELHGALKRLPVGCLPPPRLSHQSVQRGEMRTNERDEPARGLVSVPLAWFSISVSTPCKQWGLRGTQALVEQRYSAHRG